MRFAFYGRVSTEDQQDPTSSKGWQLSRARALIEPHGGEIVREFFDIGQSRSLPWKRRPEACALLDSFRDPTRGFTGVVIGEPARAFYGNQFGLTFPVFVHYGVELWVPEVGGRVDPGSDAHDLVMSLYGGMSKGERNRIKIRVRSAMAAQAATEGRFLGGRPPYGYQLVDAGPHPNPGKASDGKRLHQLAPDPVAAPVVQRIYAEYLAGRGLYAIAEGLTRDGIPSPSGHDPARNRHRLTSNGAWGKSAVRAILRNPRYTGRQVWNRQRRDEVLIDVEDVALGHQTKLRWNDKSQWVWSEQPSHEPLISPETFEAAQQRAVTASALGPRSERTRTASRHRYVLAGLIRCGLCGRKMQGLSTHGRNRYRCRFPEEYALKAEVDHPRTVYLPEDVVVPELDSWLGRLFDPSRLDETCAALAAAPEHGESAQVAAARKRLLDCDHRLERYRAALENGADPSTVAGWIKEVRAERLSAERIVFTARPDRPKLTPQDVRALIDRIGDIQAALGAAETSAKADLYAALGLKLTYEPADQRVLVEAVPLTYERVGGGT
jgi:site-specific DNA recombinase